MAQTALGTPIHCNLQGMTMITLLIVVWALVALLCWYLAACAGAERWLTLREWLGYKK